MMMTVYDKYVHDRIHGRRQADLYDTVRSQTGIRVVGLITQMLEDPSPLKYMLRMYREGMCDREDR
jgi:hypothetical protein